ncbi:ATP-dependent DNA ligase [Methylacidimicrobium sp. AP8]|uniref:RNA ligase n=1 Tax=Methylacidimicrobium sp. AP8 TaxID=2730359 RepID=UPI0018C1B4C4|nr:RNA ligase [Methylacidimicrobium sp. AP8]CAB4242397.1 ATP-dependent DNA ligase [Methylacidimicrobium sp. AP8]
MIPESEIHAAVAEKKAKRESFGDWTYTRLLHDWHGWPRGTLLADGVVVPGYPKIGRVQTLAGIRSLFHGPFWVEEKVDGYNVRIFRAGDALYAATRGGLICPFTTDRIADLIDPAVFSAHPEWILCGEVTGPETPYVEGSSPLVPEGVGFFLFDLMQQGTEGFFPVREKQAIARSFRLPEVPGHGRLEAGELGSLRDILLRLDAEGREGVVLKEDSLRGFRAKYVTGSAELADISSMSRRYLDVPPEYFTERVLRLALFLEDIEAPDREEWNRRLGEAFLSALHERIGSARRGRCVGSFVCRFHDRENALRLLENMARIPGHEGDTRMVSLEKEAGFWVLRFEKLYRSTTGFLHNALGGSLRFD